MTRHSDEYLQVRGRITSRSGFDLEIRMASSSSFGILLISHICGTMLFTYTLYHHLQIKDPVNRPYYGGKFKFLTFLNVVSLNRILLGLLIRDEYGNHSTTMET